MNTAVLREKHDKLLTQLYHEEARLKDMLSKTQDSNAIEIAQIKERIKTLEEELNTVRVEMFYL